MNKTAIKNFAIWARRKLISDITYKAGMLGITEKGIAQPLSQSTKDLQFFDIGTRDYVEISGTEIQQRNALVAAIRGKGSDHKTAFRSVIEEVAYTWFNRLIAVRFMEVNDYLPSRIRVLSSENPGKLEPDFVTTPFDTDLTFSPYEKDVVLQLKEENKLDELFRMLFIKQCNKLSEILPELFEQTSDYTELLLNISFTDQDGIVYHLTHDIREDDFDVAKEGQVEIIGWMYQYYISERHDQVININKGIVKKEDIPAATQLFTTDWVVRYMVDNSLGKYWIERNPQSNLANKLEFLALPKDGNDIRVDNKISPAEMTFFDPCMGSGHILVYAFDVLMEIYRECGYSDKDAAESIVENNLFGVDIDRRAYQLAYFAVMMKARQYSRRILTRRIKNGLSSIEESNGIGEFSLGLAKGNKEMNSIGEYLFSVFLHAKEIGSLQQVKKYDYDAFEEYLNSAVDNNVQTDMLTDLWFRTTLPEIRHFIKQARILSQTYAVVCTNPPYMNKFEGHLKSFILENYKDYSGDLFSAFMYRNFLFCKQDGYSAFMTPFVWMFIKTYEKLRVFILKNKFITTLVQMEYSAFEEATVPICSFVIKNTKSNSDGIYMRLTDFKGGMNVQKEKTLEAIRNVNCGWSYSRNQCDFLSITGSPIAYWVTNNYLSLFSFPHLSESAIVKEGLKTGDNERFIRIWSEVAFQATYMNCHSKDIKWFPHTKGGEYRKWYGNQLYVLNYKNNGEELKSFSGSSLTGSEWYLKESISYSRITSSRTSFRYTPIGSIPNMAGLAIYTKDLLYTIGWLNTKIVENILSLLNPTINFPPGTIANIPFEINGILKENVCDYAEDSIRISKGDWDSFETSWDFSEHPFVRLSKGLWDATAIGATMHYYYGSHPKVRCPLELCYMLWQGECNERFKKLKSNEEELNRIFIDIYGLQDELTPEVEDKDVTVRKADLQRDIKSFISYAVGCMFGRYSLDAEGLAYAGGKWDSSKYKTYIPDDDNCIPITDEEYFKDDIVGRFVEFVKVVFGEDTLEENLNFIADALGNKGSTARNTIRLYFLNDFFKDHCQTYSVTGSGKRPIYWLFDSGKQNGFKALVYMHRWNADTVGNLRIEYLHKMQNVYDKEIDACQDTIDNSMNNREIAAATKRKEKLIKQQKECKDYDALIAHIALSRIDIDLDDGVKVNYRKVQTGADGKFCEILADSKDIMAKEK